jgi:hypothetical protein
MLHNRSTSANQLLPDAGSASQTTALHQRISGLQPLSAQASIESLHSGFKRRDFQCTPGVNKVSVELQAGSHLSVLLPQPQLFSAI